MYHGSNKTITEIKDDGPFGGVFASSEYQAAQAHGDVLHEVGSPAHLDNFTLNYEIEDAWGAALAVTDGDEGMAEAIIEPGTPAPEDTNSEGIAERAWEMQRLRGELARRLGYTSVEIEDEHGTSYLCLSGCTIQAVGNETD